MGKYNSSVYRVRPLMEVIERDIQAFNKWLSILNLESVGQPQSCYYDGVKSQEKQLKPGKRHLEKLIDYLAGKNTTSEDIRNVRRKQLLCGDLNSRNAARLEALKELDTHYEDLQPTDRAWYIFEGFTCPDIFIEGEEYVIVCEGKWTEPHITVETTNLKTKDSEYRNQMVRHIQGALAYTHKRVFAFYIVDADCGYLEDLTPAAFRKQLNLETIMLSDDEKKAIQKAFFGYMTWQDIQRVIPEVRFLNREDIV